ncbi:MAG: hypothetical protein VYD64_05040 [Pseudomonadota bacterium]|nr:hypothetical protein [Pseudomonadota bacterium]
MNSIGEVDTAILKWDGACRDINFLHPTWSGVRSFVRHMETAFRQRRSCDDNGTELTEPHWRNFPAAVQNAGTVLLVYSASLEVLTNIQIFIVSEDNGEPFVELTFFPDNVARSDDVGREFVEWVKHAGTMLEARRLFCRYENAAWEMGDTSEDSGVFFVLDL